MLIATLSCAFLLLWAGLWAALLVSADARRRATLVEGLESHAVSRIAEEAEAWLRRHDR